MEVTVNDQHNMKALVDSGSSDSYIHPDLVTELGLPMWPKSNGSGPVMMASTFLTKQVGFITCIHVNIQGRIYKNLELTVMDDLC